MERPTLWHAPARALSNPAPPRVRAAPQAFKAMHGAYVDASASPFYTYGTPLASRAFEAEVAAIAAGYSAAAAGGGGG